MHEFVAGKGINAIKLNDNFTEVKDKANSNENSLIEIDNHALRKDGSNITQTIVEDFNRYEPEYITSGGVVHLEDNKEYFLTPIGNVEIVLPTPNNDMMSHTIVLVVQGSDYSLSIGTEKYLNAPGELKTEQTYQILYIYNKIDKSWYYCLGQ